METERPRLLTFLVILAVAASSASAAPNYVRKKKAADAPEDAAAAGGQEGSQASDAAQGAGRRIVPATPARRVIVPATCKGGYEKNEEGRCVPSGAETVPGVKKGRVAAVCKGGYSRNEEGRCVPDEGGDVVPARRAGYLGTKPVRAESGAQPEGEDARQADPGLAPRAPAAGQAVTPGVFHPQGGSGKLACPKGMTRDENDRCVRGN